MQDRVLGLMPTQLLRMAPSTTSVKVQLLAREIVKNNGGAITRATIVHDLREKLLEDQHVSPAVMEVIDELRDGRDILKFPPHTKITAGESVEIAKALKQNRAVCKVDLQNVQMSPNALKVLVKVLKKHPTVTSVNLSGTNAVGGVGKLIAKLIRNPSITELNLAEKGIKDVDAKEIAESLMFRNKKGSSLPIEVNLEGNAIRLEGAKALTEVGARSKAGSVKLHLSGNQMGGVRGLNLVEKGRKKFVSLGSKAVDLLQREEFAANPYRVKQAQRYLMKILPKELAKLVGEYFSDVDVAANRAKRREQLLSLVSEYFADPDSDVAETGRLISSLIGGYLYDIEGSSAKRPRQPLSLLSVPAVHVSALPTVGVEDEAEESEDSKYSLDSEDENEPGRPANVQVARSEGQNSLGGDERSGQPARPEGRRSSIFWEEQRRQERQQPSSDLPTVVFHTSSPQNDGLRPPQ
ncbi:MAG: hypothetical protein K0Q74_288 [Gammaproteobacteria bacterium]|nr:hypothetical protein [Gammaproteobacteria bacterium]